MTAALAALASGPAAAEAAGPPGLGVTFSTEVLATSARFHALIDPEGLATTYRFEYLSEADFQANGETFAGAAKVPTGAEAGVGAGSSPVPVKQSVAPLDSATAYRYRVVAKNSAGTVAGEDHFFVTRAFGGASPLLDDRAWELVSPPDKNGGVVGAPEAIFGGGDIQAAAGGGALTFSLLGSFGEEASGAPGASQYLAMRGGSGWITRNVTAPTVSGAYGEEPDGVPYRLFSAELSLAVMLDGRRCAEGEGCPRSYSLRDDEGAELDGTPALPELDLAAASADLGRMIFSAEDGLREWDGSGALVDLGTGAGSAPAAPIGALSADGERLYWTDDAGALHLHEAGTSVPLEESGSAAFQTASVDGALAFWLKEGTLHRYSATTESSTPLAGEVQGVLGASADGATVFYQGASGLWRRHEGTTSEIAPGADAALLSNWPPASGAARVSADGSALAFLSKARLTGYDNTDQATGQPDAQLFLWREGAGLVCVSCNPTNQRPIGAASVPGAIANGTTRLYKPRTMTAGARRLFFESADALALSDTNDATDVYEWEAEGTGDCAKAGGCLGLVSSGRAEGGDRFLDASASGADAYFLTSRSLVGADSGLPDVYDAREGGGFAEAPAPIACEGDACQALPSEPEDPEPGTLLGGPGNAVLRYPPLPCPQGKHRVRRGGKARCVAARKAGKGKRHKGARKGRRGGKGGRR